jgi:hypothetical protein
MALRALAMARVVARRSAAFQCVALGRTEFSDQRFHFRKPRGLIGAARRKLPQRPAMGQECGQRSVGFGVHDNGLTSTPLSQPISLPMA